MNGAEIIIQFLMDKGVDSAFGYPGGPILVLYDAIYNKKFPHILSRHEQGAVHGAEGYAKVTGKPGVVIATSGPGATNLVTGIADAYLDSIPLLAITGAVARQCTGKDAFQEADITGITQPITKHNYLVMDPEDLLPTLEEAWNLTTEGRPGPVLVNVPKDIMVMEISPNSPSGHGNIRHRPPRKKAKHQIDIVLEAFKNAKKPLMLLGGGVIISENGSALARECIDLISIPTATTMMAKGALPEHHPLNLGMVGMHGTPQANSAIGNCDFLLAIGTRFSDRLIGDPDKYNQNKKRIIVHVDIDPAEIGKNVRVDIEIEDEVRTFFRHFNTYLKEKTSEDERKVLVSKYQEWVSSLDSKKARYEQIQKELVVLNDRLMPQAVVKAISDLYVGLDPILVTDVGQHQIFATQYFDVESPRSYLTSGGLGTMGFGLPAAIGAIVAAPTRPVVVFVGDGSIQMTIQELGTLKDLDLPVKIVIMDNKQLGMVRQWQELFYGKRYSHSILDTNPDFVKIAEAFGVDAFKATNVKEFSIGLEKMFQSTKPFLFHVMLDVEELVYPMIPPGQNPENMIMPGMD